jgi:hypothetical protein
MYRIIERGGNGIGPRKGFQFAQEFGRDINIPMMYGVEFSDPGLRNFVNEYLKVGGSINLECYQNYHNRKSNKEKLDIITIADILKLEDNYTDEENALHQRLVDALSRYKNKVTPTLSEEETVKQKQLQRRLEKTRQR